MANLKITFPYNVNVSAQEGDILYFSNTSNNQGANSSIYELGPIIDISRTPFIHSIAGQLSVAGATSSTIEFYNFNSGINVGMNIECIVSGSTSTPAVLAENVLAANTTIATVSNIASSGTSITTSPAALDLVGGHNYKFKLTTPGTTTLEVEVTSGNMTTYFNAGCGPCVTTASFLLFSKDNDANLSSMLGYFAKVNFKNNSTGFAELFAVGSEITQSSK
tara:strand:+ start:310 stop:972 length:663 start_codon:yes stop_codon:yes gene_type:complete